MTRQIFEKPVQTKPNSNITIKQISRETTKIGDNNTCHLRLPSEQLANGQIVELVWSAVYQIHSSKM